MKRKLMVVFIVLAVLTAGCTQTQEENEGPSVKITPNDGLSIDFTTPTDTYYVDPTDYQNPGSVTFRIDMQNTGQANALLQSVNLYRAAWISDSDANILGNAFRTYRPEDILDMTLEDILNAASNELSGQAATVKERLIQGVDPENGIPGGRKTFSQTVPVNFKADTFGTTSNPSQNPLRPGESSTYGVGLRTKYQYYTDAKVEFTVLPMTAWREENPTRNDVQVEQTAGPVDIKVDQQTPINVQTGRAIMPITITNVGDGRFGRNDQGQEFIYDNNGYFWNSIPDSRVYIEAGDADVVNCPFNSGDTLVYNGQKQAQCTVDISDIDQPTDLVLRIHIVYDYVEDESTEVKLVGRGGN